MVTSVKSETMVVAGFRANWNDGEGFAQMGLVIGEIERGNGGRGQDQKIRNQREDEGGVSGMVVEAGG